MSAPKPSAVSSRVAAASPGISVPGPYLTRSSLPDSSTQSNFGVVPPRSLKRNRHSIAGASSGRRQGWRARSASPVHATPAHAQCASARSRVDTVRLVVVKRLVFGRARLCAWPVRPTDARACGLSHPCASIPTAESSARVRSAHRHTPRAQLGGESTCRWEMHELSRPRRSELYRCGRVRLMLRAGSTTLTASPTHDRRDHADHVVPEKRDVRERRCPRHRRHPGDQPDERAVRRRARNAQRRG